MNKLMNTSATDSNRSGSPNEPNTASQKIPSYIAISCAINGYSTSKYISSNDLNSPSNIKRLNDASLYVSSLHDTSLDVPTSTKPITFNKLNGQPFLDTNRTIESYNSFKNNLNRFNNLSNHADRHPKHHQTNSNYLNHSNQFDSFDNSLLSKDRLNDSSLSKEEDDSKSLVQKRIESLYGQNFASNWKDRKERSKSRIEKPTNDSFRSPSCPPEFITNGLISSKKNLPVLKYIQNTIFSSNNLDNDHTKDNTVQQHSARTQQTKSIEVISNQPISPEPIEVSNNLHSLTDKLIEENKLVEEDDDLLTADKENDLLSNNFNEDLLINDKDDQLSNKENDLLICNKENDLLTDDLLMIPDKEIELQGVDELDKVNLISSDNEIIDEEEHGGRWYLKKLDEEINKIHLKIDAIETICLDENLNNREEIDGKIRACIGKGHLLINQKLSQFRDLCNKNINQTPEEQYKTLNQDLEGFYEMVSYQIDDIHKTFDEILFLKNNNWIVHNDLLNPSPRKGSKNSSRANSRNSSKPSSRNASKEDLRRLKLREAKRKLQNQQQSTNDDIVIFLPSNNKDEKSDDL